MSKKNQRTKDILKQAKPEEINAAVDDYFSRKPLLTPRLKNWEEDLPENNAKQSVPGKLIQVTEINDTWLEIPRYENIMWGGGWIGSIVCLFPVLFLFPFFFQPSTYYPVMDLLIFLIGFFCLFSIFLLNLRTVLLVPRGTPIRFNRARQKIYIYDYQRRWSPWVRWPTTIRVFDWANIHGEMTREVDRYDQGYRLYGAVCDPGTNNVRERFVLSYTVGDPAMLHGLWSHCCQYMQGKEVPPYPLLTERPKTWALWDTVRWPEAIDLESQTAPDEQKIKR
ncbi:DUF6708 domain-containing protein [Citrobacter freundii]|nr:hypothetical protein [Citrobacter freundii]